MRSSIRNTANVGWFSSDRTIREYADRNLERAVRADKLTDGSRQETHGGGLESAATRTSRRSQPARTAIRSRVLGPASDRARDGSSAVFAPEAISVRALTRDGELARPSSPRRKGDFFEALIPSAKERPAYRVEVETAHGDAGRTSTPMRSARCSGRWTTICCARARIASSTTGSARSSSRHEGVDGVHFAVWAPNATRVSVVGDFNRLGRPPPSDAQALRQRRVGDLRPRHRRPARSTSIEIVGPDGALLPLKADPFGFEAELRPVDRLGRRRQRRLRLDRRRLHGQARARASRGASRCRSTRCISARGGAATDGRFLTYDELADQLIPYVADLGFTHIELLPISEHPLDASWGYQPIGLFAPTRRFGDPAGFARFVDRAHAAGLGVILDWVPAHFPTDAHGLAHFDGTALYEHADPRKGFHPDWNTAIYNFGRHEVANFLYCNALYWVDRFHIDGLRVDAVASMLYLDYSRKRGRMAAQRRRRQREPRGDRLPAPRQRARLRRLPGRGHDRRGIDRLARRLAADRRTAASASASSGTWAGCTTRSTTCRAIRSIAAGATTR